MSVSAAQKIVLSVDASKPGMKIDRNIFGQFAEHLGHGIYDGIWVGPDSRIPNTRGIRNDVVDALKALKVVIRHMQNVPGKCSLQRLPIFRCGQPPGVAVLAAAKSCRIGGMSRHSLPKARTRKLFKTVDFKPRGRNDGANRPIAHEKWPDPSSPSGFSDQGSPYPTQDGFGRPDSKRRTGTGVV